MCKQLLDEDIKAYLHASAAVPEVRRRTLLDETSTENDASAYKKGAGTCTYKNPFTQMETCVQLTGSQWAQDADKPVQYCENGGIGLPNTVGTYVAGAVCAGFDDEKFAGVCVTNEGKEDETTSVFVLVPDNMLASCDLSISGCETFGGGKWHQAGGECSKEGSEEALTSKVQVDAGSNATALAARAMVCAARATRAHPHCGSR